MAEEKKKKEEKSGLQKLAEMFGGGTGIAVKSLQDLNKRAEEEMAKATGKK